MLHSLYDELGVPMDAGPEVLRRAYLQQARTRHPDVSEDSGSSAAMRRLNEAWAILGNPATRREYDAGLRAAAPVAPADEPAARPLRRPVDGQLVLARLLNPWVLAIAVLAVLFVVTAYAGHGAR